MQPNPLFGLVPLLLILPLVVLVVAAVMNFRRNPTLSGLLALLAGGYALLAGLLFRSIVVGG